MKFSYFKSNVINPKNQIIIDKKIIIQNIEYHFISLYEKDNKIILLTLNAEEYAEDNSDHLQEFQTKREELLSYINQKPSNLLPINKLTINNAELQHSSSNCTCSCNDFNDYLALNYIINLGIDLTYLDDQSLSNLVITYHEFENITENIFDYKNLKIDLSISTHANQKLIDKEVALSFEKSENFYLLSDNSVEPFTARLIEFDYWGEIIPDFLQKAKTLNIDFNEEEYIIHFEEICPKDMNLLCVAYKSTNQLNFYLKELLDAPLNFSNSAMSFFIHDSDSDERYCLLKPITKASMPFATVELFSYYENITTEYINIL